VTPDTPFDGRPAVLVRLSADRVGCLAPLLALSFRTAVLFASIHKRWTRAIATVLVCLLSDGCATRPGPPAPSATFPEGCRLGSACSTTFTKPTSVGAPLVSSGPGYTCAVHAGRVLCWGQNDEGQLGDNTKANHQTPAPVSGISEAVGVRSGEGLACALTANGAVACWGEGLGTRTIPGIADAVDVAASFRLVCAVRRSGTVACAGLPWRYAENPKKPLITELVGVDDAIGIASTRQETCVIRRGGTLACFASDGVPGRSDHAPAGTPVVTKPFPAVTAISQLAGNYDEFCAVLRDGRVGCWKDRTAASGNRSVEMVGGLSDAAAVAIGLDHKCVRRRTGNVACWGIDLNGMLGSSASPRDQKTPVTVQDLTDAKDITAGDSFSCARRSSGTVVCWGSAHNGELGDGSSAEADQPITVSNISDAVSVAAGKGFSCAAERNGSVWCWGHSDWSTSPDIVPPHRIPALQGATELHADEDKLWAMRGEHLLGILPINAVVTNDNGPPVDVWLPPALNRATAFAEIDDGLGVALLSGGQIDLWLDSFDPKVGFNVIPVRGLDDVVALAGDSRSACAVRRNGRVTCLALAMPELGASPDLSAAKMMDVEGVSNAATISGADGSYAAVLLSGQLARWRIESGVAEAQWDSFASAVTAVAMARNLTCALLRGGQVVCTGSNSFGELGAGSSAPGPMHIDEGGPNAGSVLRGWVPVTGLPDALDVATGVEHACAVRRDGRVVCWGNNAHLEVGAPFPPFSSHPVTVSGLNGG
jgi:alpha-tubulin suppressor-like RCC1 family protein